MNYTIIISPLCEDDGGGFLVEVPELPGCMTDGETREEAARKAEQAIETWIEAAKETGRNIPEVKFWSEK